MLVEGILAADLPLGEDVAKVIINGENVDVDNSFGWNEGSPLPKGGHCGPNGARCIVAHVNNKLTLVQVERQNIRITGCES